MNNGYNARDGYKNAEVVKSYDEKRFTSLYGRTVDVIEKKLILRAFEYAEVVPPGRVMDLPCGTGRVSLMLAELGFDVTGVDVSEEMVKMSQHKYEAFQQKYGKFSAMVGDGEKLKFEDNAFDAVVSLRLFGHTPDAVRQNIVREFARVTRRWCIVAYYLRGTLQCVLRKGKRQKKGVYWNPIALKDVKADLQSSGLMLRKCFFLFPGVSETVVVLAEKSGLKG
ncbi:MAG: methyltransferase domain-containing protein [Elusimicrobiota bacterium]